MVEHLDLLALKWTDKLQRPVSRQEVIKTLLAAALEEHPVSADEARRLRARSRAERRVPPAKPKIRLLRTDNGTVLVSESGDGGSFRAPKSISAGSVTQVP